MHSAKNIVGRVLLFFSVPAFIYVAVSLLISSITQMNDPAIGWFNFGDETARTAAISFIVGIVFALMSISAVIAGIRGKSNFIFSIGFVVSILCIFLAVLLVVSAVIGGVVNSDFILSMILLFVSPALYIVGDILLILDN